MVIALLYLSVFDLIGGVCTFDILYDAANDEQAQAALTSFEG